VNFWAREAFLTPSASYTDDQSSLRVGTGCEVLPEVGHNRLNSGSGLRARTVRSEEDITPLVNRPKRVAMKTLLIAIASLSILSLTACNTVEGAGKDVQATGAAVERAAERTKPR
jgi:predicted small secreted protein